MESWRAPVSAGCSFRWGRRFRLPALVSTSIQRQSGKIAGAVKNKLRILLLARAAPQPHLRNRSIPNLYAGMRWRLLGPFRGGKSTMVSGVPGNPAVVLHGDGRQRRLEDSGWRPGVDLRQRLGASHRHRRCSRCAIASRHCLRGRRRAAGRKLDCIAPPTAVHIGNWSRSRGTR